LGIDGVLRGWLCLQKEKLAMGNGFRIVFSFSIEFSQLYNWFANITSLGSNEQRLYKDVYTLYN